MSLHYLVKLIVRVLYIFIFIRRNGSKQKKETTTDSVTSKLIS